MINRDSQVSVNQRDTSIQQPLIIDAVKTNSDPFNHAQQAEDSNSSQISCPVKIPQTGNKQQSKKQIVKQRLMSLDVYRGLTVLGMIMVDQIYQIDGAVWWLQHPDWNGLTCADLVFPSFLFIMGTAIPLAVNKSKPIKLRNVVRVILLFAIGLLLNIIEQQFDFQNLRILGILQRMSICYGINMFIHWITNYGADIKRRRIVGSLMIAVVILYVTLMMSWSDTSIGCPRSNNLDPYCNFAGYVDRAVFTEAHIMEKTDPEGIISTMTATFTTYIGYLFGLLFVRIKKQPERLVKYWLAFSFISLLMVYPLTLMMPFNKRLYTISFLFITLSTSALTLSLLMLLTDILPKKYPGSRKIVQTVTQPFNWLGLNPLAIFIVLQLFGDILNNWITFNEDQTPFTALYESCFSWMGAYVGTLMYSLFYGIILSIIAGLLFRFKLFLRL